MAHYGVILQIVIGCCVLLVTCSKQGESASSNQENKDSHLKTAQEIEANSASSSTTTSNQQQEILKPSQIRNRRSNIESGSEHYYGDTNDSGLDSAFLYSDQIMQNLLKTHTPQPLSYARSNFFLNLLKPRTTRYNSWDDHSLMHFGKRAIDNNDEDDKITVEKSANNNPVKASENNERENVQNNENFDKKSGDPWHSMMSFGKKSDNPWDHNTLHFGKKDDPWHNMMSFGKKSDDSWEHNTLHFGKKDEPWHNMMSFGKRFEDGWDHNVMHFGKRDEPWHNMMSFGKKEDPWHSTMSFGKRADPWHATMSFGKKAEPWHSTMSFGKKTDPWHSMMSFGKRSENPWDHSTLHFGKRDEPWHNMMSFGKKSDNMWDHNTLHFGKKDEPWHNMMSFGKRSDDSWDHNTMQFEKRNEPWHNMMSFGKKSINSFEDTTMEPSKKNDPWHSMMSFGKRTDDDQEAIDKREDPWHNMMSFGKKNEFSWDNNTQTAEKRDEPWHNMMSFGKKADAFGDHFTLHFGKREDPYQNSWKNYDEIQLDKKDDPWHNMMSFGKKSESFGFDHNTMHFGKRNDPWHSMMSFGKKSDNLWDHNTLHFGKRDQPWHNLMSFGKKSDNPWDEHSTLHFGKRENPWHSMMSFGKRAEEPNNDVSQEDLHTNSYILGVNDGTPYKKSAPWDNHNTLHFGKKSNNSFNSKISEQKFIDSINLKHVKKRSVNSWDNHNVMHFGKKSHAWDSYNTLHFGKKSALQDLISSAKRAGSWDLHNTLNFGKKSNQWDYHNTMHFGKKSDLWDNHNTLHFGKRDPWDNHNTMHFGKKRDPWGNHNTMHFGKKSNTDESHEESKTINTSSETNDENNDINKIEMAGLVKESSVRKRSIQSATNDMMENLEKIKHNDEKDKSDLNADKNTVKRSLKFNRREGSTPSITQSRIKGIEDDSEKGTFYRSSMETKSETQVKAKRSEISHSFNDNQTIAKTRVSKRSLKSVEPLDGANDVTIDSDSLPEDELQRIRNVETNSKSQADNIVKGITEDKRDYTVKSRINKRSVASDSIRNMKNVLTEKDLNIDPFDEDAKDVSREMSLHFGKRSITNANEAVEKEPNYPWLNDQETQRYNDYLNRWNTVSNGKRSYPWETQNVLHFGKRGNPWENHFAMHFGKRDPWDYHNTLHFGKRDPWDNHNTLHFGKKFAPWDSHYKMHFGKRSKDWAYNVLHFGKKDLGDDEEVKSAVDNFLLSLSEETLKEILEEKSIEELLDYLRLAIHSNDYNIGLNKKILKDLTTIQNSARSQLQDADENFFYKLNYLKQYLVPILMKLLLRQESKDKSRPLNSKEIILDDANNNELNEDEQYLEDYPIHSISVPSRSFADYVYMENTEPKEAESVNSAGYFLDSKPEDDIRGSEKGSVNKREFRERPELKRFWAPFQGPKSIVYPHAWFASQIRRSSAPRSKGFTRNMDMRMAEKKEDPFNSYMHFGRR